MIFFPGRSGVHGVRLPANLIPPEDPIMKVWEHGMVAYLLEIPNLENPFFHCLAKFQKLYVQEDPSSFYIPRWPHKIPIQ